MIQSSKVMCASPFNLGEKAGEPGIKRLFTATLYNAAKNRQVPAETVFARPLEKDCLDARDFRNQ